MNLRGTQLLQACTLARVGGSSHEFEELLPALLPAFSGVAFSEKYEVWIEVCEVNFICDSMGVLMLMGFAEVPH
jgi:hypothetical protein